jgi:hypothetical protein
MRMIAAPGMPSCINHCSLSPKTLPLPRQFAAGSIGGPRSLSEY